MANRELACVAGVWNGREREFWEREFQAWEKREGRARKQTRAWSRALIPFPFPFQRLPRRLIGSLSNDDGDVYKNRKSKSFWLTKRQLCTCLTPFCTFLCHHCATTSLQCLISRFVEDVYTRQRLSFSFAELLYSLLEFKSRKNC